jgi:hypothetical protein
MKYQKFIKSLLKINVRIFVWSIYFLLYVLAYLTAFITTNITLVDNFKDLFGLKSSSTRKRNKKIKRWLEPFVKIRLFVR